MLLLAHISIIPPSVAMIGNVVVDDVLGRTIMGSLLYQCLFAVNSHSCFHSGWRQEGERRKKEVKEFSEREGEEKQRWPSRLEGASERELHWDPESQQTNLVRRKREETGSKYATSLPTRYAAGGGGRSDPPESRGEPRSTASPASVCSLSALQV